MPVATSIRSFLFRFAYTILPELRETEEMLLFSIFLDLDARGFLLRVAANEDMANLLLAMHGILAVSRSLPKGTPFVV